MQFVLGLVVRQLGFALHLTDEVTGTGSFHNLAANDLGIVGALLQVITQGLGHDVFHGRTYFARNQFVFGLAAELGFRHFDRQHAAQAFAHVIARHFNLGLLILSLYRRRHMADTILAAHSIDF
mgnify:CR=1 FL=1